MRILLDENLPHELRHALAGHDVATVAYMKWSGLKNGELLRRAGEHGFDALVTNDVGMQYEHNHAELPLRVLVLRARSNQLEDLLKLVGRLLDILQTLPPRTFARIESTELP